MELNNRNIKKIILILFACILFTFGVYNFTAVLGIIGASISLFFPFILGCAIAFIINVPMNKIEGLLFGRTKKKSIKKVGRPISIVITFLLLVAVLIIVSLIVAPELVSTVKKLVYKIPDAWDRLLTWIEHSSLNGKWILEY